MEDVPPDWPLTSSPMAIDAHASNDSFISLYRHDSPQLTLHDFHKFQQSPVLSVPADFDLKRLRRKPSTPNLAAARPLDHTDHWSHWSPSAILPRQTHSLSQQTLYSPSFPPLPVTPRPRPSTYSPSLSSTVTTLQSTPAQTPIYRGGARQARDWSDEQVDWSEPIRTKRKFESLRRAKRLPRQRAGSSSGGQGQEELWEVYAAVFDPPLDEDLFKGVSSITKQHANHVQHQSDSIQHEHDRPVTFQKVSTGFSSEPINSASAASRHTQRRDPTGTSSVSLSRFDFPRPPGLDNWEGTFGHLAEQSQSSSPATIHYRGASFDVVNPHASLILGARNIETPAEIDGLLDDYFDRKEDKMQYDSLTGEPSQISLRIPSESSRRVLYDDPGSARRNILRVEDDDLPSPPPNAILNDLRSPRAQKMSATAWHMAMANASHRSDPFDLTLSESGSNHQLKAIDAILREGRNAEFAPASPVEAQGLGITNSDHGADTQATVDQSTDPTIREILDGYDYTRVPKSPEEVDITDSPAIERARKISLEPTYDTTHGLISPLQTPVADRSDSANHIECKPAPFIVPAAMPTPPAPVYTGTGLHYYTGYSELPTTDQTYGETNQLLLITPETAPEYPPYTPGTPCNPKTCNNPSHIHIRPDPPSQTPATSYVLPWYHDNKENIPPKHDESLTDLAAAADRFRFFDDDNDYGDLAKPLQRSSSFYPDDIEDDWETQYSDSHYDLPRNYGRISLEEYANAQSPNGPVSPIEHGQAFSTPNAVDAREFERRCQIKKSIKQLESKIMNDNLNAHYGTSHIDKYQRRADFDELERLRQLYPSTSDHFALQASESLMSLKAKSVHKLQRIKPFRPNYNPRNSFNRIVALGKNKVEVDTASDHRGLLDSPITPTPRGNELQWNETMGTFTTLRGEFSIRNDSPASCRGPATELWSPFVQDPTVKAIYGSQSHSATTTKAKITEVELKPLGGKSKRYKPAAMSNQYEPRELHLLKSKRMNDAQLTARQPGWRMRPQVAANSPLGKHNEWSFAAHEPMLLKPETDIEKALRADQDALSKRYLWLCAAFPPLTLAFGLGAFDSAIKRKIGEGIQGASPKGKRNALLVYFPLGCMFWAILIIALYLMVLSTQGELYDGDKKKNNGAPFSM